MLPFGIAPALRPRDRVEAEKPWRQSRCARAAHLSRHRQSEALPHGASGAGGFLSEALDCTVLTASAPLVRKAPLLIPADQ